MTGRRQQWNANYRTLAAAKRNLGKVRNHLAAWAIDADVEIETGVNEAGQSVFQIIAIYR